MAPLSFRLEWISCQPSMDGSRMGNQPFIGDRCFWSLATTSQRICDLARAVLGFAFIGGYPQSHWRVGNCSSMAPVHPNRRIRRPLEVDTCRLGHLKRCYFHILHLDFPTLTEMERGVAGDVTSCRCVAPAQSSRP